MKANWLLVSLGANAALVLALGWLWRPQPMVSPVTETADAVAGGSSQAGPAVKAAVVADPTLAPFQLQAIDWSRFTVADWKRYRDELGACGCPRQTVREIIVPLVKRHFAARSRVITDDISAHFWEMFCPPAKQRQDQLEEKFKRLDAERDSVLAQLFPEGWRMESRPTSDRPDERMSFLPPDRQQRLLEAEKSREAVIAEAHQTQTDATLREELIRQARAHFESTLAELLSPEELKEWRVRSSGNAWWIRQLEGIELSTSELAEIIRLQDQSRDDESRKATLTTEAKDTAIKELLGAERFAEFNRANDNTYKELSTLTRRAGLTQEQANTLWESQRRSGEEAAAIIKDTRFRPDERELQLAELRQRQEQTSGEILGASDALEAWRLQQARWLKETFSLPREDPVNEWMKGL